MASNARQMRQGWRYRVNVGSRVVAATIGAYVAASLFGMALARLLPPIFALTKVEAVLLATLGTFLLFPALAIWAFLARGPVRAWGGIAGLGLVCYTAFQLAGAPA